MAVVVNPDLDQSVSHPLDTPDPRERHFEPMQLGIPTYPKRDASGVLNSGSVFTVDNQWSAVLSNFSGSTIFAVFGLMEGRHLRVFGGLQCCEVLLLGCKSFALCRRRHSHPRSRGHVSSNLIYPPLLSQSQTVVVGGLWNCQSAVRKADFISSLASHYSFDFLALTETWIPPQNTATPAALSSAYTFSHSPRESGRGGGTVSVTSPINLFIFVIYRPPGPLASYTLSSLPDHESFSSLPLDSATDTLLSSLSSTMDLLCPLSTIRMKNSSPAPWLSDVLRNNRRELRSAARKWKKSKLDTDLISYRTLLSKFSLDVTSAKTSFYKEKLETSAQDPQKLHNIFSSLLNPPAPPSPSSLTAEDFATFYTEKIEGICQTFTSLPTSPTSHSQHSATPSLTQLSTVASEEVLQITRSCNPTTCPLDPIPSAMLQTISPDLLSFITTVINGSLMSGHVPTAFKKARVIPILKKPALDPSDISNYRPVSLLSFLSKILERVVCNQLSDYLMQNNLHDPKQSGFKAAHSTETALLAVTEKLHAARSAKLSSVLILLDLSAAFDTVDHKTLLSTLRSLGICGTAWEWFASYLDGRSYQTLGNGDEDDRGPWEQDSLGGTDGIPRVARGQGCHPDPPKTSLQDHTPPSQPDIGDGCRVAWSSRLPGSGRLCRQYRSRVEEVPQVLRTEEEEQNQ
ncbi:hypothetical protein QTP70_022659 [Hemibagrus guttatus]|uniref:Reverse transcriptase domain-containing protein n=1 Tax=Hemibagrus guttatus TaxID=175788 RepID=A0AAE0RC30_9TELE|nr:hypothetical protein QTP70_022659 [Hemibagrus guttatus]